MIIKRYNESRKSAEVLHQYDVLHVDNSEFSRYAIGSVLMEYDFIVKRFASVKGLDAAIEALKSGEYDLLLINASAQNTDPVRIKKLKKRLPNLVIVVYNFSLGEFEKLQLLKAGINGLFDPDTPFEELLFSLQELRPGSILQNNLVGAGDLNRAAHVTSSAKDFSKEEVNWIRAYCREGNESSAAESCGLSPVAAVRLHQHLRTKAGCESLADFIRLATQNKWIRDGEKLLAAANG